MNRLFVFATTKDINLTIIPTSIRNVEYKAVTSGSTLIKVLNASINIRNGMGGLPKTYTPVETTPLQLSNQLQVLSMKQEL